MKKPTRRTAEEAEEAVLTAKATAEFEPALPGAIDAAIYTMEKKLQELRHLKARFSDNSIAIVENAKDDLAEILK